MKRAMFLLWFFVATAFAVADEKPHPPLERPKIHAVKVNEPPNIDGLLDDPAWQKAVKVTGFWRMDFDELASEQTEVLICHDNEHLYVAFLCHDSQPQLIRAQQRKRGGAFGNDDWVSLGIDPLNRPRLTPDQPIYIFYVNPIGTQDEIVPGGAAAKIEWRGDWKAAAKITEKGWQAEMAIPFRILRLPTKLTHLGLFFARSIPSPRAVSSSYPYRRGQAIGNMAEYGPLDIPSIRPPIITMASTSLVLGKGSDRGIRIGWDAKQHILGGLQWQLTINPDFRNIEDVIETIDFTYVPRRLPDRRPFFSEGQGYFPSSDIFYSRFIEEVVGGLKLFGKTGRTEVGTLFALEPRQRFSILARINHELSKRSLAEVSYAHRTKTNGSPALRLGWFATYPSGRDHLLNLTAQWTKSGGNNWLLSVNYPAQTPGHWAFWGWIEQVSDRFQPSLGFAPEVNYRSVGFGLNYYQFYRQGNLLDASGTFYYSQRHFLSGQQGGQLLDRTANLFLGITSRKGFRLDIGVLRYHRPPFRDQTFWVGAIWKMFDQYRSGWVSYQWGRRANQHYRFLRLSQSFRFSHTFSINLNWEQIEHFANAYQLILSGVYDISDERSLLFRWVKGSVPKPGEPKTLLPIDNFYLGFRQFSRKGLDIYLLLGDPNARHTQFKLMLKVLRVF